MGARRLVLLIGLIALAGCGGGAAVNRAPVDPCETRVPSQPADTLTVVLFEPVDLSHAPWGRNREERFIFSHLYETLLTIDCRGEFRSGLAKTVVEASDGWLVTLRDDAHFWDETDVTSQDVVESFKPAIAQGIAIKSVDPVDDHTLLIRGYNGRFDVKLLTLQMLSVTKPTETVGPPIGTGSWMIDESKPVAEAIVMRPALAELPMVRFVQGNASDARDILDGSVDAMITDDPTAIEYARSKEQARLIPLTWDQVYVLVSRTRATATSKARQANPDAPPLPELSSGDLDALARDVVRVEARGGSTLLLASEKASVQRPEAFDEAAPAVPVPSIMYVRGDDIAQGLAERIVALAAMDTCSLARIVLAKSVPGVTASIRARGVDPVEFRDALAWGQHFGYIVPLSWDADYPFVTSQFTTRAPWAVPAGGTLRDSSIPLVETHAQFIAISDRIGFIDPHNGSVRILAPTAASVR